MDPSGAPKDANLASPWDVMKTELEDVLSKIKINAVTSTGFFSEQHTISEAPNPLLCLCADELGTIGLPLSEPQAKHIISYFENGSAIARQVEGGAWEVDAAHIRIDNDTWSTFVMDATKKTCAALGVNYDSSKLNTRLRKLLFYTPGSQSPRTHQPGSFLNMLIVFPSAFMGGAVHFSHNGTSSSVEISSNSLSTTSILSWFTGVTHRIEPLMSGYCLALSYDLNYPSDSPQPSMADPTDLALRLRNALSSWKQDPYNGLSRVIYLLDAQLTCFNLAKNRLESTDSRIVSAITPIAKDLGFCLGLALLDRPPCGGRGDTDTIIRQIKKISGNGEGTVICPKKAYMSLEEEERGVIPSNLPEVIDLREELADPEDSEDEYYDDDGEHWWRACALVIWPEERDLEVVHGDKFLTFALDNMQTIKSEKPTVEDSRLVASAITLVEQGAPLPGLMLPFVCALACRWRDQTLWCRAVDVCSGRAGTGQQLGGDSIIDAIELFGLENILPSIEHILRNDLINARRLALLDHIASALTSMPPDWIQQQRVLIAQSLQPLTKDDERPLINCAKEIGGFAVIEDVMLPQLKLHVQPKEILSFVMALHDEKDRQPDLAKDQVAIADRVIVDLLVHTVASLEFFEGPAPRDNVFTNRKAHATEKHGPVAGTELALPIVEACLRLRAESGSRVIEELLRKLMVDVTSHPSRSEEQKSFLLSTFFPFFSKLVCQALPEPISSARSAVEQFYTSAIGLILGQQRHQKKFDDAQVADIIQAAAVAGGVKALEQSIVPYIKAANRQDAYDQFIRQICRFEALLSSKPASESTKTVTGIVTDLLKAMIATLSPTISEADVVKTLDLCYETGNGPLYTEVLGTLHHGRTLNNVHQFPALSLSLIPALQSFAHRHSLDPIAEPFTAVFKLILLGRSATALGPKPRDEPDPPPVFRKITCRCEPCTSVTDFLNSDADETIIPVPDKKASKHMSKTLKGSGVEGVVEWCIKTAKRFTIKKKGLRRWLGVQQQYITVLKQIHSDDKVLELILGQKDFKTLLDPSETDPSGSSSPTAPGAISRRSSPQEATGLTTVKFELHLALLVGRNVLLASSSWNFAALCHGSLRRLQECQFGVMGYYEGMHTELEDVLSKIKVNTITSTGFFLKQYPISKTPNPRLRLGTDELGTIDLPLREPHAKHIISSFENGSAIARQVEGGAWEVDAAHIRIDNDAWSMFVTGATKDMCAGLGVKYNSKKLNARLRKLSLYTPGSHVHQPDSFSSMLIVLPSAFMGGVVHFSHNGTSTPVDISSGSLSTTSILSWFMGIIHRIEPLTSGYRIALSFELIRSLDSPRPSAAEPAHLTLRLRDALSTWKQNPYSGLSRITYLLDTRLAHPTLAKDKLKVTDSRVVSAVAPIAKELGFCLGLGLLDRSPLNVPRGTKTLIRQIMAIGGGREGTTICNNEAYMNAEEERRGVIPSNLAKVIDLRQKRGNSKDYEDQDDDNSVPWSRACALFIWPEERELEIVHGSKFLAFAHYRMQMIKSEKPAVQEYRLVASAIAVVEQGASLPGLMLPFICNIACGWRDRALWCRAVNVCSVRAGDGQHTRSDNFMTAIGLFGLESVLPSIKHILRDDLVNARRLTLLDDIAPALASMPPDWIRQQRALIAQSLQPLAEGDERPLIDCAKELGGFAIIEDIMLPQFKLHVQPKEILFFIMALHDEKDRNPDLAEDQVAIGDRVIVDLLAHIVVTIDFFEAPAPRYNICTNRKVSEIKRHGPVAGTELALPIVEACLRLRAESGSRVIEELLKKLVSKSHHSRSQAQKSFLLSKFLPFFNKFACQTLPEPISLARSAVDQFYISAIGLILGKRGRQDLEGTQVADIIQAAIVAGGVQMLEQSIVPYIKATNRRETYDQFIRLIYHSESQLSSKLAFQSTKTVSSMITDLLDSMTALLSPKISEADLIKTLELCFDTGNGHLYTKVLLALHHGQKLSSIHRFPTLPLSLISTLRSFAYRHNLDLISEPFTTIFKLILLGRSVKGLGPETRNMPDPPAAVPRLPCRCPPCASVADFLSSDAEETTIMVADTKARKHFNKILNGPTTEGLLESSEMNLRFTIKKRHFRRWQGIQGQYITALKQIHGDDEVLERILGREDWNTLLERLDVPGINIIAPPRPIAAFHPLPTRPGPSHSGGPPHKKRRV
ncbi:hypothetical protein BOTBODRAFT_177464 [Botryobasidium botryosum FD-172 SS1]|uniref:Uncharacterized protein n=1 Tax=Botryobasidium botryosum (strain FD-172 SS1) TaxID=930990 RepID=A0A067MH25_BOTB1|nr:hypothetical protein BOTBODRAFT_177464 [Botryobasidium botryosum FD-172 SS1]